VNAGNGLIKVGSSLVPFTVQFLQYQVLPLDDHQAGRTGADLIELYICKRLAVLPVSRSFFSMKEEILMVTIRLRYPEYCLSMEHSASWLSQKAREQAEI